MRVLPGSPSASQRDEIRLQSVQHPKVLKFRAALKNQFPAPRRAEEWQQFRRLAVGLFGPSVLLPQRKGETFRRLNLSPAQLRHLAQRSGQVSRQIEHLQAEGRYSKKADPASRARLYARVAARVVDVDRDTAAGKTVTFTAATINDDYTDRRTNVPDVKATVKLVQEAKNTDLRQELSNDWGVHQNSRDPGKKGSAVVWDKDRVRATDRGVVLGVTPQGQKMMKRWISWTDVVIDGVKVRMASAHRPPRRFNELWPEFDRNLARFVKSTRLPLIIGMDSNTRDPSKMERITGLKWAGLRRDIDGFLVSPGIRVDQIREGPRRSSDHNPVIARFRVTQR